MVIPFSWQSRVDAAVAASEAARPPVYGHHKIMFRTTAASFIYDAAAARGVSVSALARRATLAMSAQILGLAFQDLVAADPTIQLEGDHFPAPDPSGRIGGPWEITGLRDGSEQP